MLTLRERQISKSVFERERSVAKNKTNDKAPQIKMEFNFSFK